MVGQKYFKEGGGANERLGTYSVLNLENFRGARLLPGFAPWPPLVAGLVITAASMFGI